jgi:hypothetical protein
MRSAIKPVLVSVAICIAACTAMYFEVRPWKSLLTFDDAYMFTRYARNFATGLGISWNPDGVHTYGLTSIPWMFFVLPAEILLPSQLALQICSCLAAAMGIAAMAVGVCQNSKSTWLSDPAIASFGVIIPLFASSAFRIHMFTGMDTLFAVAVNAVLVACVLRWQVDSSLRNAIIVGLAASLAATVRLDSALCALLAPFLAWRLSTHRTRTNILAMCGIPVLVLIIMLAAAQLYFGTALPLSFYAKSAHSYSGFLNRESPAFYFLEFLTAAGIPMAVILILANGKDLRRFSPYFLPSLLTIAYLLTVRQIMGSQGRFFFPQLPFFIVPALLVLDRFVSEDARDRFSSDYFRALPSKIGVVTLGFFLAGASHLSLEHRVNVASKTAAAEGHVPEKVGWFQAIHAVADVVSKSMPNGGCIACSEVGFVGDRLPNVAIIDLAGLNNTQIGLNGFSMSELLAQKPDFIWLPHTDYTGLRATILGDPRLYQQYTVVNGAFNYGIGVRKTSRHRDALMSAIRNVWPSIYGNAQMADYIVHSKTLVSGRHVVRRR